MKECSGLIELKDFSNPRTPKLVICIQFLTTFFYHLILYHLILSCI